MTFNIFTGHGQQRNQFHKTKQKVNVLEYCKTYTFISNRELSDIAVYVPLLHGKI